MALSDVLKRYGETGATEGIMVPSANVQSITTEQEVYDSATDGIMTINNEQYLWTFSIRHCFVIFHKS